MEGKVPTPQGEISVYASTSEIKVNSPVGTGTLRLKSRSKPSVAGASVSSKGNNMYEISIPKGKEFVVKYSAL